MANNSPFYPIIIRPYDNWSDDDLGFGTSAIFLGMSGNAYFVSLANVVADYGVAVEAYKKQLSLAGDRDKNAIAKKNNLRTELTGLTISLGYQVAAIANSDIEALLSSCFPLRRKPTPVRLLPPENFRITADDTKKGMLTLKTKLVKGVKVYVFKYSTDLEIPVDEWQSVNSGKSLCKISGLKSGSKYWIIPGAEGTKGQQVWGNMTQSPYVP